MITNNVSNRLPTIHAKVSLAEKRISMPWAMGALMFFPSLFLFIYFLQFPFRFGNHMHRYVTKSSTTLKTVTNQPAS